MPTGALVPPSWTRCFRKIATLGSCTPDPNPAPPTRVPFGRGAANPDQSGADQGLDYLGERRVLEYVRRRRRPPDGQLLGPREGVDRIEGFAVKCSYCSLHGLVRSETWTERSQSCKDMVL